MLMHDLTLGPVSPIVAMLFGGLGTLLSILLATRARRCTGRRRARLVAYATVTLAVPTVWLPALVAIMAMKVDGSVLLFAPEPLAISLGAAVAGTGLAMLLVCYGRSTRADRILSAGLILVATIAGSSYMMVQGLRTGGEIVLAAPLAAAALGLSAANGLALTGALAMTPSLRAAVTVAGAAGVSMSACEHLFAASLAVRTGPTGPMPAYDVSGLSPLTIGLPTVVLSSALIAMIWYFTMGAASASDLRQIFQTAAQMEQLEPSIVAQVKARVSLSSTAVATPGDHWAQSTLPMRAIPLYSGMSGAFPRLTRPTVPMATAASWLPRRGEPASSRDPAWHREPAWNPEPAGHREDAEPMWQPGAADAPSHRPAYAQPQHAEPVRAPEQVRREVPEWGKPTAEYSELGGEDTAAWLEQGRGPRTAGHWDDGTGSPRNSQRPGARFRPTNSRYGPMPRRGSDVEPDAPTEPVAVAQWGGGSDEPPSFTRVYGADPLPRRNTRS
jgi:hypothetical protein